MKSHWLVLFVVLFAGCTKANQADSAAGGRCPKDLLAARGTPCSTDGQVCGAGPSAATHFLMCTRGNWTEMDAPPPPPPPPTPPTASAPTAAVPSAAPKPWDQSCTKDSDCVVVHASGCCPSPCPAGVVNVRDKERAEADLAAACREQSPHPCPSAGGCRGHAILCEKNQCAVVYAGDPGYRQAKP